MDGPESLVVRSRHRPCNIVGLAEIRVIALLADGRDAPLRNLYTDEQGARSLLDLAVHFGLADIAAALAEHGIGLYGHQSICDDEYFQEHASRSLRAVVQVAESCPEIPELLRTATVTLVSECPPLQNKEYSYLDIALKLGAIEDAVLLAKCGVPSRGYDARDLAYWARVVYTEPKLAQTEASLNPSCSCSYMKTGFAREICCKHMTLKLPMVTQMPRTELVMTDGEESLKYLPCDHGMTNCRFCCHRISLDFCSALHPSHDDHSNTAAGNSWSVFLDMLKGHLIVAHFSSGLAEFLQLCRFKVEPPVFVLSSSETLSLLDIAIRFGAPEVAQDLMHLQVPVTTDVLMYICSTCCKEQCCKEKYVGHKQLRNVLATAELAGFMAEDLIKVAIVYGDGEVVAHFTANGLAGFMVADLTELAIQCGNVSAASHLTANEQNSVAKQTPDALLQFPVPLKRRAIKAAVAVGADLRKLRSQKCRVVLCNPPPTPSDPYPHQCVEYWEPSHRESDTEPLLAKAIRHGFQDLAQELASKGCDSNLTVEALMCMVVFGQFKNCDVQSAALAAYNRCKHRHHLAIVQVSRWWKRSLLGRVSVLNVPLVEKIAALASAVPAMSIPEPLMPALTVLCKFLPHKSLVQSARLCRAGLAYIVSSHIELWAASAALPSSYPGPCFADAPTMKSASPPPFGSDIASAEGVQMPTPGAADQAAKLASMQEEEEISEALRASTDEAVSAYNADLVKALSLSKIERGGLSDEKIVVLRLSCRTVEVEQKLLHSAELLDIRDRVVEAGCELMPEWASGAIFLVPLTQDMIMEANIDELRAHHVLALEDDVDCIKCALAEIPKRRRPKVKGVGAGTPLTPRDEVAKAQGIQGGPIQDHEFETCTKALTSDQVYLTVERTFLSYLEPKVVSECSQIAQSAPSCVPVADGAGHCKNPRRWGKFA